MAIILCIETATEICSVALSENGKTLGLLTLSDGMRHSSSLTGLISSVLEDAAVKRNQLAAVAISNGPGSYTGLRVGASTAKGICMSLEIPLIAIPTLEALAYASNSDGIHIMSTVDARRMEVYAAIFFNGKSIRPIHSFIWTKESVSDLSEQYDDLIICGNGVQKGELLLMEHRAIQLIPSICTADKLTVLADTYYVNKRFANLAYHDPAYFKSPNITKAKNPL